MVMKRVMLKSVPHCQMTIVSTLWVQFAQKQYFKVEWDNEKQEMDRLTITDCVDVNDVFMEWNRPRWALLHQKYAMFF